jgi:hypothetical protein
MLLKLLMPPYYRAPEHNSVIVTWYKREGEWVDFGDDLFDFRLSQGLVMRSDVPAYSLDHVERMARQRPQQAQRRMEEGRMPAAGTRRESAYRVDRRGTIIRVTAADRGTLGKIYAAEGECRAVGELLAVLTTNDDETVDAASPAWEQACAFRINDPAPKRHEEA